MTHDEPKTIDTNQANISAPDASQSKSKDTPPRAPVMRLRLKSQDHKPKSLKPKIILPSSLIWRGVLLVVISSGLATGGYYYFSRPIIQADPFNPAIRSSVTIPLYYPDRLPKGYMIKKDSVAQPESGIVTFKMVASNKPSLYISESPAIKQDRSIKLLNGNLKHVKTQNSPLGHITTGYSSNGVYVSSLVIGQKTWIIFDTKAQLNSPELQIPINSLKLSQP